MSHLSTLSLFSTAVTAIRQLETMNQTLDLWRYCVLMTNVNQSHTTHLPQKLLFEVQKRATQGETTVEMADMIDKLQQSTNNTSYCPRFGLDSVTLPLIRPEILAATPSPFDQMRGMAATFSVHVPNFNDQELMDIVSWLEKAPQLKQLCFEYC
jgi:hypothetical protein